MDGMMELAYWVAPYNVNASRFTFYIRINDIGIWDLVPEHWTFKSPDMETPEAMTLDPTWNDAEWPRVVDSSNVGNLFPVVWDFEADGLANANFSSWWSYCAGVVRLGSAPDHEGGF